VWSIDQEAWSASRSCNSFNNSVTQLLVEDLDIGHHSIAIYCSSEALQNQFNADQDGATSI
jgi:hypothetical protein